MVIKKLNEVSENIDNIAGATAVLKTLEQRCAEYKTYADFASQVYNAMTNQKQPELESNSQASNTVDQMAYLTKCETYL